MNETPPLLLLPAWPLWSGGVRRPGPNRWGFDWHAPRLEPRDLGNNDAHHVNHKAHEFFTSTDNLARRLELIPGLARRKKIGSRTAPIRRKQGSYPDTALDVRVNDIRADAAEGLFRLLALVVYLADWRTGRIVFWRRDEATGKSSWKYPTRTQLADCAGFPVRVDTTRPDELRVRAYQLDDRIGDAIAAGLLIRHEEIRKQSVEFRVTNLAWIIAGVSKLRDSYKARLRKDDAKAEAAKREAEKAARRAEPTSPDVAVTVARMARSMDPSTNDRGWPTRPKPPDK